MSNISLSDIKSRLGIIIPGEFITETLGIQPTEKIKRGLFFTEDQYVQICKALAKFVLKAPTEPLKAVDDPFAD